MNRMFVDEVDIHVEAGDGGSGALAFRREKFVPRGGPDGGNGGTGGSVYLVASPHRNTLVNFRFHPEFQASAAGTARARTAPARTARSRARSSHRHAGLRSMNSRRPERQVADLTDDDGQRVLVAQGGRGGRGNAPLRRPPIARRAKSSRAKPRSATCGCD